MPEIISFVVLSIFCKCSVYIFELALLCWVWKMDWYLRIWSMSLLIEAFKLIGFTHDFCFDLLCFYFELFTPIPNFLVLYWDINLGFFSSILAPKDSLTGLSSIRRKSRMKLLNISKSALWLRLSRESISWLIFKLPFWSNYASLIFACGLLFKYWEA